MKLSLRGDRGRGGGLLDVRWRGRELRVGDQCGARRDAHHDGALAQAHELDQVRPHVLPHLSTRCRSFARTTRAGRAFLMGRWYYLRGVRMIAGISVVGEAVVPVAEPLLRTPVSGSV